MFAMTVVVVVVAVVDVVVVGVVLIVVAVAVVLDTDTMGAGSANGALNPCYNKEAVAVEGLQAGAAPNSAVSDMAIDDGIAVELEPDSPEEEGVLAHQAFDGQDQQQQPQPRHGHE